MCDFSKFQERLDELLFEKNLNSTRLATAICCGRPTINHYLGGVRVPSVKMLVKMADYFCCDCDFLLGREAESYPHKFYDLPLFSEQFAFLLRHLNTKRYRVEKATGIADTVVSGWYNGSHQPTLDSVIRLAEHFDCSIDFVIGRFKE